MSPRTCTGSNRVIFLDNITEHGAEPAVLSLEKSVGLLAVRTSEGVGNPQYLEGFRKELRRKLRTIVGCRLLVVYHTCTQCLKNETAITLKVLFRRHMTRV